MSGSLIFDQSPATSYLRNMRKLLIALLTVFPMLACSEVVKFYYDSGELQTEASLVGGIPHGTIKGYFKNGDLEYVRMYDEGSLISEDVFPQKESPSVIQQEIYQVTCNPSVEQKRMVKFFQSNNEPSVKDAVWIDNPGFFKVGVYDNGTNRDGFAKYVCLTLHSESCYFRENEVWVQVIDIAKLWRDDDWVKLGEFRCRASN